MLSQYLKLELQNRTNFLTLKQILCDLKIRTPKFKSGDNVSGSNLDLKRTLYMYVRVEEAGPSITHKFIYVWARQEIINQFAGTQGHNQPGPPIFFLFTYLS